MSAERAEQAERAAHEAQRINVRAQRNYAYEQARAELPTSLSLAAPAAALYGAVVAGELLVCGLGVGGWRDLAACRAAAYAASSSAYTHTSHCGNTCIEVGAEQLRRLRYVHAYVSLLAPLSCGLFVRLAHSLTHFLSLSHTLSLSLTHTLSQRPAECPPIACGDSRGYCGGQ